MARRSTHTQSELRERIIGATRDIVAKNGAAALSAREIAREIEYSAGTIYNVFKNLDELMIAVQRTILEDIADVIASAPCAGSSDQRLKATALAYLDHALANAEIWSLLCRQLPEAPTTNRVALLVDAERISTVFADCLRSAAPDARDADLAQAARTFFAGLHGIVALVVTGALPIVTPSSARDDVACLADTFHAGFVRSQSKS
ncbi:MAG: TetR/AcrR family transcriptional regulator [Hyphomicrobium sp.]